MNSTLSGRTSENRKIKNKPDCGGSWFSLALVAEGMRKTRVMAMLMGITLWLSAFLAPLMLVSEYSGSRILYGPVQINPLILLSFMIFAPFLTLYIFEFLNSRAGSDLYHAFPVRRQKLAISFLAAVAFWLLIILSVSALITLTMSALLQRRLDLDTSHVLICFLQMLAASLLVEMSVFTAMSVTGTLLTNIVTALALIFVPRFLIMVSGNMITDLVPMLSMEQLPAFFQSGNNTVTGVVFNVFRGEGMEGLYERSSLIYTACAAVLYMAAGVFLFVKRPSQTAGRPALGEGLQAVIRALIAFVITTPVVINIAAARFGVEYYLGISSIVVILAYFLTAFGSMYVYEFVSARRVLNFKRFLKGVALVLVLDLLWGGAGTLAAKHYAKERIPEDQIASVSFPGDHYPRLSAVFEGVVEGGGQSYLSLKMKDHIFSAEELLRIVSVRHSQRAQGVEPDEVVTLIGDGQEDTKEKGTELYQLDTDIQLKDGKTLRRNLVFMSEDLRLFWEDLARSKDGVSLLELPDPYELNGLWAEPYNEVSFTEAYETYRKELRKIEPERWLEILGDRASYEGRKLLFSVNVGQAYYDGTLPVTEDFPETGKVMDRLHQEQAEEKAEGQTEGLSEEQTEEQTEGIRR